MKRFPYGAVAVMTVILILPFFIFLLVNKDPKISLDTARVKELIGEAGYECHDSTGHFKSNWKDGAELKASVSVRDEGVTLDFFEFDEKSIGNVRRSYDEHIKNSRWGKDNRISNKVRANYSIYCIENEKGLTVRSIVDDTMIYAYGDKEEITELCTVLGYIDKEVKFRYQNIFDKNQWLYILCFGLLYLAGATFGGIGKEQIISISGYSRERITEELQKLPASKSRYRVIRHKMIESSYRKRLIKALYAVYYTSRIPALLLLAIAVPGSSFGILNEFLYYSLFFCALSTLISIAFGIFFRLKYKEVL
ncbi:MAG: hypothetical protein E7591_09525 [Ruminococcaceae bacterium]|nr:hypothetical protein [Oscillospiraceae bacterium]